MEDIDVIIRVTCQELYDNLRKDHSIFSDLKSQRCLNKLNKINENNEYRCTEIIRDELGLVYKNYMVLKLLMKHLRKCGIMLFICMILTQLHFYHIVLHTI